MQSTAIIIFIITYILIICYRHHALKFLGASILALFLLKVMTIPQMIQGISFDVLGVFFGTMLLSSLFIYSGVPAFIVDKLIQKTTKTYVLFLIICGIASVISAFVENVATVLIVAPLAIELCRKLKITPVPLLIGISICSNLEGTSTLIGDAPSIIMALKTGMNFFDFFWFQSKVGIFFAIQFAAIGAFTVLYFFFKKYNQKLELNQEIEKVKTWTPTIFLSLMTLNLALEPFLPFGHSLAGICVFWSIIGSIWYVFETKEKISIKNDLDWYTLFFLTGIFILVQSLIVSGTIDSLANFILQLSAGSVFKAYVIIVLFSVFVSAFVDNIPYTIAMIPVAQLIAQKTGTSQFLFVYGLVIGTCLGGNITPIGSSSNVVVMGILRKEKAKFNSWDFIKLGLPFTIVAVVMATVFVWVVWR